MQYCPVHQRGLLPGGYDPYTKRMVAEAWRPLTRYVADWAQLMAATFPQEVQMHVQRCDQCVVSEKNGHAAI